MDLQATSHQEPPQLMRYLPTGVAILAAALGGLGIIFWVAANWESLGRMERFTLLQGFVLAMCAGALWRPAARVPLSLLAFLATGGLFAYFGQTYQTGADPWQLFALWAVLTLPLCLAVRHDALWAPWALVTMSALSLWIHARTGYAWSVNPRDVDVHLRAWGGAVLLTFALGPVLERYTGAGPWALRAALTLSVIIVTITALAGLFGSTVGLYWCALAVLAGAAAAFTVPRLYDIYCLSALGLGVNIVAFGGIAHALFEGHRGDAIGRLLVLGLAAAAMLAASVSLILNVARRHASEGASA